MSVVASHDVDTTRRDASSGGGAATIFDACRRGDTARVLRYTAQGGCTTETDAHGMTMLHHAAFGGDTAVLRAVLATHATQPLLRVDAADADGWTALHYAADRAHTAALTMLLDAGANVNARDALRRTPLHLAAARGDVATLRVLLARGAMRDVVNIANVTPAGCAAAAGHDEAAALLQAV